MGSLFSRIGSDPYYASYERSFEQINKEKNRLQQVLAIRAQQQRQLKNRFLTFSVPMAVIAFAWAAWVRQQPLGTYTSQEHFVRMLPVFLVPASAYALYLALSWVLRWVEIRDRARLTGLQAKLKKMVNELKDSTRYQRTFQLLQKYDPDFQPPTPVPVMVTPGPRGRQLRHMQSAPGSPSTPIMQGLRAGPIDQSPVPSSTLRPRAGNFVLSALDHLANVTMGSDPVLVGAVREAKQQAEKLREQLQASEAHAAKLKQENMALRAQLGEDLPQNEPRSSSQPNGPSAVEQSTSAATILGTSDQHHGNQEHREGDAVSAAHGVDKSLHSTDGTVDDAHEMVPHQPLSPKRPAPAGAENRHLPAGSLQPP